MASDIASKGRIAVSAGNEAVNAAFEMSLAEGLKFEKRLFHALFGIALIPLNFSRHRCFC